jgi:hypothetical protein
MSGYRDSWPSSTSFYAPNNDFYSNNSMSNLGNNQRLTSYNNSNSSFYRWNGGADEPLGNDDLVSQLPQQQARQRPILSSSLSTSSRVPMNADVNVGDNNTGTFHNSDMNVLMMLAATTKKCEPSSWYSGKGWLYALMAIIILVIIVWIIIVLCKRSRRNKRGDKRNCCKACGERLDICICFDSVVDDSDTQSCNGSRGSDSRQRNSTFDDNQYFSNEETNSENCDTDTTPED